MKKANVINLIKYYMQNNETAFRDEYHLISSDFCSTGDSQLGMYIASLLASSNVFAP